MKTGPDRIKNGGQHIRVVENGNGRVYIKSQTVLYQDGVIVIFWSLGGILHLEAQTIQSYFAPDVRINLSRAVRGSLAGGRSGSFLPVSHEPEFDYFDDAILEKCSLAMLLRLSSILVNPYSLMFVAASDIKLHHIPTEGTLLRGITLGFNRQVYPPITEPR